MEGRVSPERLLSYIGVYELAHGTVATRRPADNGARTYDLRVAGRAR